MNLEEQASKTLSTDLLSLLANGQAFSDVTFAVQGRHVYAHRCVLAARSHFFRMIFCGDMQNVPHQRQPSPLVIPVGIVGYDVFLLLLQFLYSGQLGIAPQQHASTCKQKACWHTHCTTAVDFALETLNAAQFFGVEQLSVLTQKHLAEMAEKASIEDVMRILVAARMQEGSQLWSVCSKLVAKSGLPADTLHKHLAPEVAAEIQSIRHKTGYEPSDEQRIVRMRKALETADVELVRLMVMGEGLNLDNALALHYAVGNCSRKVVQSLLELDAANVNLLGPDGRAPLHIATQMGDPEMIAVLLDHRADANCRMSTTGARALDLARSLASDAMAVGALTGCKFRMCADLLEAAASMGVRKQEGQQPPAACIAGLNEQSESPDLIAMRSAIATTPPHDTHLYPVMGHAKVLGELNKEPERGEPSDPIARLQQQLLYPPTLHVLPNIHQHSPPPAFSCHSVEERSRKRYRDSQEAVLKDITNATSTLQYLPARQHQHQHPASTAVEEEVNSGWQFFLQDHQHSPALITCMTS